MDINIHIAQVTLTDGSNNYDVKLTDVCDGRMLSQLNFSACSEQNAFAFAEKMKQLIDEHTVDGTSGITCNY